MSNEIQRIAAQKPTKSTLQMIVMAFAVLYWLSPVDAMPFMPFDDIAMMVAGYLFYTKNDDDSGVIE